MYVYDIDYDQYKKVTNIDVNDTNEPFGHNEFPIIASPVPSVRSSGSSVRSSRRFAPSARIISKAGRENTILSKLPNRLVYITDLGNTLLNIRWRWILATVCLVNFASFFIFGGVWMWLAHISGDFEKNVTQSDLCVVNTKTFTGYMLLSVETIITIGYGYRYPTEKCKHISLVLILQAFINVALQGALVSIVYVKISKPFTKNPLALFSKKAIICFRDGNLCFVLRIIDLLGKVSVGTTVTVYFIDKEPEHPNEAFCMRQIEIEPHGFLIFPLEIVHVINAKSPLWKFGPHQILKKRFEIVAIVEGISEVTGQLSQNRTSYTNSEVLWGHRFSPCVEFSESKLKYVVHYKQVNKTIPFDTPLCSAEELDRIKSDLCFNMSKDLNSTQ